MFYVKLTYRPEIDGLRAIAVLAVVLYHAQIDILGNQTFKGGFIGVDIFFVISGYLITSIILKELNATGSFSFKYFYERRVRRILPVLLIVMLASLPFAWVYLLPSNFVNFSKSILYSLGFSSNFFFWNSGQEYGALNGLLKPFLHTWSLSIEEQFYILFPLILLIIYKFLKKYLIQVIILGFVISLCVADWGSRNYPSFNFYILPSRGWELLAGSIMAYFEINLGHRSKNKKLNLILPTIGLLLICHSIIYFNDKMFNPSFYTLSPILGVCLIIWFSNKDELITKILSSKFFVGIGLISYSLYLWHYPIFAFDRVSEFSQESLSKKLIIGFLLFFLSILSYYFIEQPARKRKYKFKNIFIIIFITISFLIFFNSKVILNDGFQNKLPKIISQSTPKYWKKLKNSSGEKCFQNKDGCKFNVLSDKKIFIIGDSQMATLTYNLKKKLTEKNYQFISYNYGGCFYFPDFNLVKVKTQKKSKICNNEYFSNLKEIFSQEDNSIIIIGGRLPLYLSNSFFNNQEGGIEDNEWGYEYKSTLSEITLQNSFKKAVLELSNNNKVILIYPIPEVGWDINQKLYNRLPKKSASKERYLKPKNYITTSYDVYKDRTKLSFELLNTIQDENIYRVYPHKLFCNTTIKDRCLTHDNKNIFYADYSHPSSKGAEMINNEIIKKIEKIELKSN